MVIKQVGFDIADVLGGGPGQGAVGYPDPGDGGAHGAFLVAGAVLALEPSVCYRAFRPTIAPGL
ncbi:hypothetical protein PFL02_36550 [Pseudomonas fluorescens]|nr:hypothetical protein PFL02_36550 [Pseudomonas fluorescens]